jgi:hypothetical protein
VESTSYVAVNLNVRGQRRRQTVDVKPSTSYVAVNHRSVDVDHRLRPASPFLSSLDASLAFWSGGVPGRSGPWQDAAQIFRGVKPVRRRAYKHATRVIKHT